MHPQHTAVREQRRCSRCQASKPPGAFYRNPASVCKACHNAASRLAGEARRPPHRHPRAGRRLGR